jgi:hypothetical protein
MIFTNEQVDNLAKAMATELANELVKGSISQDAGELVVQLVPEEIDSGDELDQNMVMEQMSPRSPFSPLAPLKEDEVYEDDEASLEIPATAMCVVQTTAKSASPLPQATMPAAIESASPVAMRSANSKIPSFMRPTESTKSRASGEEPIKEKTPTKKKISTSSSSSSLFTPTASYLARMNARESEVKTPGLRDSNLSASMALYGGSFSCASAFRSTSALNVVLCKPQGMRVTEAKPFSLNSTKRTNVSVYASTEDSVIARAIEEAKLYAWRAVPKHIKESKSLETHKPSTPKRPEDIMKPFELKSLDRHSKAQAEAKKKLLTISVEDDTSRVFKAGAWSREAVQTPTTPSRPPATPTTKPVAFHFAAEERAKHYNEEIAPVKAAKEAAEHEANTVAVAALAKAKELDEMNMLEFRKTLAFKARTMPDFDAPFSIDHSKSAAVTMPEEFRMKTDERLGKALTPAERGVGEILREEGFGITRGWCDGGGSVSVFASGLRASSGSVNLRSSVNLKTSKQWPAGTFGGNVDLRASMGGPTVSKAYNGRRIGGASNRYSSGVWSSTTSIPSMKAVSISPCMSPLAC